MGGDAKSGPAWKCQNDGLGGLKQPWDCVRYAPGAQDFRARLLIAIQLETGSEFCVIDMAQSPDESSGERGDKCALLPCEFK